MMEKIECYCAKSKSKKIDSMNLIESERMAKNSRCCEFELKTPEKGKKNGMPVAIRTRDLLLRRQTLYPAELRAHLFGL